MLKAYKYRLYPTKSQQEYLNQNFGAVRFVWNQLVADFNSWEKDVIKPKVTEKTLKDDPEYSWLHDSISYALQQKRIDFDETKKQFFNKKRKIALGRMKFKKKGVAKDSFRIPGQKVNYNECIDFDTSRIKLPKMTPIKLSIDRPFTGNLRSVTVSKNKCNQYFVSVLVDTTPELKQNTGRAIGIDLGLNHLCTFSNGVKVDNPRIFRKNQAKLKRQLQHLSRKIKGSNRYNKQKLKVAKIHLKIANQRSWFNHNLSTWLVSNYDHVFMEDLNVAGMKKLFGKSISDASFSSLVNMIEYKCSWYGKVFHKIDRWYPSSKTCNCCGNRISELPLNIREWECSSCDSVNDRDLNAARNILDEGFRTLYNFTSEELSDYKRRERVNLPDSSEVSFSEAFSNFIDFYKNT